MDRDEFLAAALRNAANEIIARELFDLALPDAWLVSGCLVQSVWNVLTGRAVDYGINDYDVFYFDPDTSWAAEDIVIHRLRDRLGELGAEVEARNQARVHLWYPQKHGVPYRPLACATDGIDRFLTKNTQAGIRRTPNGYDVYAPNGFTISPALSYGPIRDGISPLPTTRQRLSAGKAFGRSSRCCRRMQHDGQQRSQRVVPANASRTRGPITTGLRYDEDRCPASPNTAIWW